MAATYRLSSWRRLLNALVRGLLRVGLGPRHTYLLTVRGRRSGKHILDACDLDGGRHTSLARRPLWRGVLGAQRPSRGSGDAEPRPPIRGRHHGCTRARRKRACAKTVCHRNPDHATISSTRHPTPRWRRLSPKPIATPSSASMGHQPRWRSIAPLAASPGSRPRR